MSVRAIKSGAREFLTKPLHEQEFLDAVQAGIEQDKVRRQQASLVGELQQRFSSLTAREQEVLPYVIAGRLNKQIAATIGTVEKTVKVHRMRMMAKLGVRCVADLVRLTERVGIAPAPVSR